MGRLARQAGAEGGGCEGGVRGWRGRLSHPNTYVPSLLLLSLYQRSERVTFSYINSFYFILVLRVSLVCMHSHNIVIHTCVCVVQCVTIARIFVSDYIRFLVQSRPPLEQIVVSCETITC